MDTETAGTPPQPETAPRPAVGFAEAARYWLHLGFISFGGPAGQIAIMQADCVDKKRWIDQQAFLRGLNYSMLLPGPEAQQLAAYIGWRLHGIWGAVTAGALFFLPGAILMMALAWIAAAHGDNTWVIKVFNGIKPAVIGIIVFAVWRIGKKTCNSLPAVTLAAAAFAALHFAHVPFPLIILAAGVLGAMIPALGRVGGHGHGGDAGHGESLHMARPAGNPWVRLTKITVLFLLLLALPVAALVALAGPAPFLAVAKLFTTAALVTFGGAYAVLPYITDAAVNTHGWIAPGDMLNGLALAETTPGPLVLVNTYVGFFAGWNGAGAAHLSQVTAGLLAAALTTYVTYLPSFYFIIAGAPYVDALQKNEHARRALSGITTAVVGVIFNLAVFLGESVLITKAGDVEWASAAVAAGALAMLLSGRVPIPALVGIGAVLGAIGIV
jgi:chromate transporter